MKTINLLPWRAQQQQIQRKHFFTCFAASILTVSMLCMFMHYSIATKLTQQRVANGYLQQQISESEQQLQDVSAAQKTKTALLSQWQQLQALQHERTDLVRFLYAFVQLLPPGVYITESRQNGAVITVHGRAQSQQQLVQLIQSVNASTTFKQAELVEVTDTPDTSASSRLINQVYALSFELHAQEINS